MAARLFDPLQPSSTVDARVVFDQTDWAATPLGAPSTWSSSLRTTVGVVMAAKLPMYIAWGPQWVQIYNEAYRPILGLKHPAGMGASAPLVWPEIWSTIRPMWTRVLQGESIGFDGFKLTIERFGYPEDCYFNFSYSPIPDDEGGVGGVLVTFVETTAWVHGEQLLKARAQNLRELSQRAAAREQQLQAILNSVSAAVITVDYRFRITLFNRAAEQVFRVPGAQVLGRGIDDLLPERFRHGHGAKMAGFAEGPGAQHVQGVERELRGRRWDGEEFALEAAISRVGSGDQLLMTIILRDMTEVHELRRERLARAAAEEASQAKSQFLSHLSHELRTPLNAVIGLSQLLLLPRATADEATVHRYAKLILGAGEQQLEMVKDLLDLSRLDEEELTVTPSRVVVTDVLGESLQQVAARAEARGIQVRSNIQSGGSGEALTAVADSGRLRQILVHLLSNAIKYNRPGGRVEVRVAPVTGGRISIAVADTGLGLSQAALDRLFTPFERLHPHEQTVPGAGVGLALSARLARLMGGDIRVQSTEGQGSTFELLLCDSEEPKTNALP